MIVYVMCSVYVCVTASVELRVCEGGEGGRTGGLQIPPFLSFFLQVIQYIKIIKENLPNIIHFLTLQLLTTYLEQHTQSTLQTMFISLV